MSMGLRNRELLPPATVDELDSLIANIQGFNYKQHDDDGSHTDVTALSMSSEAGYVERNRMELVGEWTLPHFLASDYFGNDAMTWTVTSGDSQMYGYTLVGLTMWWSIAVRLSSVGGTPDTELRVRIPDGYVCRHDFYGTFSYIDNGGAMETGRWSVTASSNYIVFERAGGATWSTSANLTSIFATGFLEFFITAPTN